ncbi:O-antigen ligase family protein [Peribacillus frigoritolerans]|uniref:O-antigen ligase family protein n=1 Tax=Peribacillus frigoritolerans TaxID=450367 RepID=UPI002162A74B|nr:O-antigen ligase family protein [Peribacillus frigoritolerans]
MQNIYFNKFINAILFLYILSLYILTYRDLLYLISNGLALLLIFSIAVNLLVTKRNIVINKFLISYTVFLGICIISVFFAIDQVNTISKIETLVLIFILMFALINYIDTNEKLRKMLFYFVISGFFASIYVLFTSDFSQITRFGEELANLNRLGINIGVSTLFCFYFIIEEKRYWCIPLFLIMFFVILLTGSRSALIFILLNIICVLYLCNRKGFFNKFKIAFIFAFIASISFFMIFNNSFLYQIIGIRIENLLSFLSKEGTEESSMNIRSNMLESGIEMFKNQPLTGYGLGNYGILFNRDYGGIETYAHNNLIELLVGVGILGGITFYFLQCLVIKQLFSASRYIHLNKMNYAFISLIFSYIILSVSSVYYYNKEFCIILAVGSVIFRIYKNEHSKLGNNPKKLD